MAVCCYVCVQCATRRFSLWKDFGLVKMNPPSAVLRPLSMQNTQSLLSRVGPACRNIVQIYKDEDMLGTYKLALIQQYKKCLYKSKNDCHEMY